jgi:hypothetical protein
VAQETLCKTCLQLEQEGPEGSPNAGNASPCKRQRVHPHLVIASHCRPSVLLMLVSTLWQTPALWLLLCSSTRMALDGLVSVKKRRTHNVGLAVPAVLPLVPAMLGKLEVELAMYQRILTYWPQFGPSLEYGICAALRDTISATARQCGLVQVCPTFWSAYESFLRWLVPVTVELARNTHSTTFHQDYTCTTCSHAHAELFRGLPLTPLGVVCGCTHSDHEGTRPFSVDIVQKLTLLASLQAKPLAAPLPMVPDVRESPRKLFGRKKQQAPPPPPPVPAPEPASKWVPPLPECTLALLHNP